MAEILGVQRTKLDNCEVVSCELTKEWHDTAVEMVKDNPFWLMSYDLQEADKEMANVWIADAHSEGREEYAEFLHYSILHKWKMWYSFYCDLKDKHTVSEIADYIGAPRGAILFCKIAFKIHHLF